MSRWRDLQRQDMVQWLQAALVLVESDTELLLAALSGTPSSADLPHARLHLQSCLRAWQALDPAISAQVGQFHLASCLLMVYSVGRGIKVVVYKGVVSDANTLLAVHNAHSVFKTALCS